MTGKIFVRDVRDYLGDVPERSSTSNLFWETSEILDAANNARDVLVRALWDKQRPGTHPFQLAVTNYVRTKDLTHNVAIPDDFWKALCCTRTGEFIPVEIDEQAPGLGGLGEAGRDYAYIAGGLVYGTSDTLVYVALPTTPIAENDTLLTDFSESFYECLELLACIALLGKRQRGALDPQSFLAKEAAKAMATLQ